MQSVTENLIFVLEFLGIVVLLFAVAYGAEKMAKKKSGDMERILPPGNSDDWRVFRHCVSPDAVGISRAFCPGFL